MPTTARPTRRGLTRADGSPQVTEAINALVARVESTTTVTLAVAATSTPFFDQRLTPNSVVILEPLSASAAIAKAAIWYSSRTVGSCTIRHNAAAASDQTFAVAILG